MEFQALCNFSACRKKCWLWMENNQNGGKLNKRKDLNYWNILLYYLFVLPLWNEQSLIVNLSSLSHLIKTLCSFYSNMKGVSCLAIFGVYQVDEHYCLFFFLLQFQKSTNEQLKSTVLNFSLLAWKEDFLLWFWKWRYEVSCLF